MTGWRPPRGPQHVVAPEAAVRLGPVVAMADAVGAGPTWLRTARLPVTATSLWTRPPSPDPDHLPLALHFEVRSALGCDHAVITAHRTVLHRPTRVGDRVGHHQALRSVGPEVATRLGPGRAWEIDHVLTDADGDVLQVETFRALGYRATGPQRRAEPPGSVASVGSVGRVGSVVGFGSVRGIGRSSAACRVWAPVHHDPVAARRAGLPGVIACTQHLAMVLEHAAWQAATGAGRSGLVTAVELRMRRPVVVGDEPVVAVRLDRRRVTASIRQTGVVRATATVHLA